uniref:Uncharacterized protein n=1 Tax=Arundo donax TaxID=35708 RepID=A0A0A9DU64_ARUDO
MSAPAPVGKGSRSRPRRAPVGKGSRSRLPPTGFLPASTRIFFMPIAILNRDAFTWIQILCLYALKAKGNIDSSLDEQYHKCTVHRNTV